MTTKVDRVAAAKLATERANLAETRLKAWASAKRGAILLMLAYEGTDMHQFAQQLYKAIMGEYTGRVPKLREIAAKERQNSTYQMEMFNEES